MAATTARNSRPALLRPGRFDRHVLVIGQIFVAGKNILRVHCKRIKLPDVDIKVVAARHYGFVAPTSPTS